MRWPGLCLLLIGVLGLYGCGGSLSSQTPPAKLTAGFWFWQGSSIDPGWSPRPLHVLFAESGSLHQERATSGGAQWRVYGDLPDPLPPANQYWLVFRNGSAGLPDSQAAQLAVRDLRRIGTERFGREEDVRKADIELSAWLQH